jgi:hypothetical protein
MAKTTAIFPLIVLGLLGATHYSFGQVESPMADPGVSELPQEEGVSSGSSEVIDAGEEAYRDPFWPVGYEPSEDDSGASSSKAGSAADSENQDALDLAGLTPEEQRVIKERMRVGGILQQGQGIWVILNNQLVKEGEEVKLDTDRKTYEFLVKQLTADRIVLESLQNQ